MTKVVPAIIPQTRRQLTEEIKKVSGFAELVQIDISDGLFTPIKTWPYNGRDQDFFEKLKKGEEGWPEWIKLILKCISWFAARKMLWRIGLKPGSWLWLST